MLNDMHQLINFELYLNTVELWTVDLPIKNLVHLCRAFIFALLLKDQGVIPDQVVNLELWCNGSTTDFGSVCLGSNPSSST